jgi:hypothetical protein
MAQPEAPHRFAGWRDAIRAVQDKYIAAYGQPPRIFRPRRFSEKMQWRKLFDRNPNFTIFCDKLATRDYIAALIGTEYLTPLYWTGGAEEIPFDQLTPPYFLKSTHASGHVLHVTEAVLQDRAAITAQAAEWLRMCFFTINGEPGYRNVPRRLIAEQAVVTADGAPPDERRLFIFNGKVAIINSVFVEDGKVRNGAFHTRDWQKLDWYFTRIPPHDVSRPRRLAEMIRIAEQLANGIDQLRVDFFDCGNKFFVGELTVYSWSGLNPITPDEADLTLGRHWRLPFPLTRALAAILFRSR